MKTKKLTNVEKIVKTIISYPRAQNSQAHVQKLTNVELILKIKQKNNWQTGITIIELSPNRWIVTLKTSFDNWSIVLLDPTSNWKVLIAKNLTVKQVSRIWIGLVTQIHNH